MFPDGFIVESQRSSPGGGRARAFKESGTPAYQVHPVTARYPQSAALHTETRDTNRGLDTCHGKAGSAVRNSAPRPALTCAVISTAASHVPAHSISLSVANSKAFWRDLG
ncbi:unnamed protein product [Pleuronectes platessa]|uniref:Uncharacterized protein n=1 Tax=Pleuronectes platessa TaxID=8262 RepID=A0A9N7UA84_PLEPL|nr:unnamed protein product [Pleuronectes platessa]